MRNQSDRLETHQPAGCQLNTINKFVQSDRDRDRFERLPVERGMGRDGGSGNKEGANLRVLRGRIPR